MRTTVFRLSSLALFVGLAVPVPSAQARNKGKSAPAAPQDQIQVVGHVPLSAGPVRRFLITQHFSSYYLYAEHDAGKSVTLIDVTKAAQPAVLADVAYPAQEPSGSLLAVAGTAALVTSAPAVQAATAVPQTLRIMDLSDPKHPSVARELTGVTAIGKDEHRGLIYVANAEGVWILQEQFALDPEVDAAYTHHVFYDH